MATAFGDEPDGVEDDYPPTDVDATEGGTAPKPAPAPAPPRVFGDYRLLREIGRGGMGVVYEAWQVSLARRVALKVLSQGLGDSRRRRRFEREARSAGRLHHTNIVPVFGFGEHEGTPYYVMQCIQGVSLDATLDARRRAAARPASTEIDGESSIASQSTEDRGPVVDPTIPADLAPPQPPAPRTDPVALDPNEPIERPAPPAPLDRDATAVEDGPARWKWVARLGVQAASGLDYAHSQGVLHRDVKPSNLILDDHGTVWVTDFGLAKWGDHQDLTQSDDVVGTLRYMPPEALDGVSGSAGDVYGLGLTLYELLARRPAFDERDRVRLIRQVSEASPPPLRKLDRRIPLDLATIVHKAIERQAGDRYASAAELGADLTRFLEDRPILARRASPAERYWRWARRNPAIATLGAILTTVLVLATIGSMAAAGRFREQAEAQRLLAEAARRARDEEQAARLIAQRALRSLEAARQEEDRTLYDTRASLAGAAWTADDYGQYRGLLDLMRPTPDGADRRGWEWRYLMGLNSETLREVRAPNGQFVAISVRPDGSAFATLSLDGTMRVWSVEDGREILTIRAPNSQGASSNLRSGVLALAYSPDGSRLAGSGGDGGIGVYDARTGERLLRLQHAVDGEVSVLALSWSSDGKRLAVGLAGHTFRVWDVDTETLLAGAGERHGGPVAAVAFSPDGRILATASLDGLVRLWSQDDAPRLVHTLRGHEGEARAVAFAPDGSRLASSGLDGTIRIWDVATGVPVSVFGSHTGGALCLAWPREGGWLASGGNDNSVRIWDPVAGRMLRKFLGHAEAVRAISASPDGRILGSASPEGVAKLWDARSPARPRTLDSRSAVPFGGASGCVAISGDGRLVASGHFDGVAQVWDAATGGLLHRLKASNSGIRALAFSPDGSRLVSSSGEPNPPRGDATVWDLADGRSLTTYHEHGEVVDSLVFLDGRRIASAGGDRKIHVWDAATGDRIQTLEGHSEGIRRLVLSRDGRTLASGADDGTLRVWDADSGRPGPAVEVGGDVVALAFAADGRTLAAAVRGGPVFLWDPTRNDPPRPFHEHARDVLALTFSPDGRLITGGLDKCVRVWDVEGARPLLALRDHGSAVTGLAISLDGARLASSSFDHTVKLWEAPAADDSDPGQAPSDR